MSTSRRIWTRGLVVGVALAALVPVAGVAEAAVNSGINHVTLTSDPVGCLSPGGVLPPGFGGASNCGAGGLPSNTVYVVQTETDEGWQYTDVVGTGATADDVWLPFDFSAECRGTYRLNSAAIGFGFLQGDLGYSWTPFEPATSGLGWGIQLPVDSNNKTIPHRNIDADVPTDTLELAFFDQIGPLGALAGSSFVEIGESMVAGRIEAGSTEEAAREQSEPLLIHVGFDAILSCLNPAWFGVERAGADTVSTPIEIVFLGVDEVPGNQWRDATVQPPAAPVGDLPMPGALAEGDTVTQAELVVGLDPADACRLNLSGVITTNGPMTVEYRFFDEMGVGSNVFTVDVDQTQTAFLDHHVMLPEQAPSRGGGQWSPIEPVGGPFDLADQDSDNEQGWFQLHVTSPNAVWSDIEGYNVEPCSPSGPDLAAKAL